MAPEVFQGRKYAEQCDIYSWSIVFWQLLSKRFSPYEQPKPPSGHPDQNFDRYSKISIPLHCEYHFFCHSSYIESIL